ncbi:MAG: hypothetical protein JNK58_10170 [Phycisphaerae bacterium]|nr:hypothetical protein [Phycisphaerae bacterium]
MRHLSVCGAILMTFACLAACSSAPRASSDRPRESSLVQGYGSLAAGDDVGRAAFGNESRGADRVVSVPITFDN